MINKACKLGHLEVVRLLLQNKAPVDVWTLHNKESFKKEIRELIEKRITSKRSSV